MQIVTSTLWNNLNIMQCARELKRFAGVLSTERSDASKNYRQYSDLWFKGLTLALWIKPRPINVCHCLLIICSKMFFCKLNQFKNILYYPRVSLSLTVQVQADIIDFQMLRFTGETMHAVSNIFRQH